MDRLQRGHGERKRIYHREEKKRWDAKAGVRGCSDIIFILPGEATAAAGLSWF